MTEKDGRGNLAIADAGAQVRGYGSTLVASYYIEEPVSQLQNMSDISRRAHFRIVYPLTERPAFEVGRSVYEIVDCSELGLRFEVRGQRVPAPGALMEGTVQFRRGESVDVSGQVLRAQGGMVVLVLDPPGITFSGILGEQRYLRSKGYTLRE